MLCLFFVVGVTCLINKNRLMLLNLFHELDIEVAANTRRVCSSNTRPSHPPTFCSSWTNEGAEVLINSTIYSYNMVSSCLGDVIYTL